MKKRVWAFILCIALIITLLPANVSAASTDKYTKVKTSQFKDLTYGKLTKKQVGWVIEGLVESTYGTEFPMYMGPKKINKAGYKYMVNRISLIGIKTYSPSEKQRNSNKERDKWCEAHPLKRSNQILSFYTKRRLKKNKTHKADGFYTWRTSSKRVYYYLGIGNAPYCKIVSAKKNSKKIILKVNRMSAYEDAIMSKYTVTLRKQKNGRFKIKNIKETWRNKDYPQDMG